MQYGIFGKECNCLNYAAFIFREGFQNDLCNTNLRHCFSRCTHKTGGKFQLKITTSITNRDSQSFERDLAEDWQNQSIRSGNQAVKKPPKEPW